MPSAVCPEVVDLDDVRVIQVRDRAGFALESPHDIGRRDQVGIDQLNGHRPAEHDVGGAIHGAHAAAAQVRVETVLAVEHLADVLELGRLIGLEHGPVMGAEAFVGSEPCAAFWTRGHV